MYAGAGPVTMINLLPWRADLRARRTRRFKAAVAGALTAGVLLAGALHAAVSDRLAAQQSRNDYLNHEIRNFKQRQTQQQTLKAQEARLLNRIAVIEDLQSQRPLAAQLLDALARLMSDDLRLARVEQSDRTVEIRGLADAPASVSGFMRRLGDSAHFDKPELVSIKGQGAGDATRVEFVIRTKQQGVVNGLSDRQ